MQPFSIHEVGARAMLPPPDILVSQWADENRVLTGGAAAERGQWRTRHYQREPMDVLSPGHPCRQVVLLSAAQMMKTEVLLNFLGFIADVDPGPVLVVERGTSLLQGRFRRPVWPCGRSATCSWMKWTGTRRARARRAIRFPSPSNARRSSRTTGRSSWRPRRRSRASAGSS